MFITPSVLVFLFPGSILKLLHGVPDLEGSHPTRLQNSLTQYSTCLNFVV